MTKKITRRNFLAGGAATLGAMSWVSEQEGTKPKGISLVGGEAGRTDTSLRVQWLRMEGATDYKVRLKWSDGEREESATDAEYIWSHLAPNIDYSVSVSAVFERKIVSAGSDTLEICTRPPTPQPPYQIFGNMIDSEQRNYIAWDETAITTGISAGKELRVILGKENGLGEIVAITPKELNKALLLTDRFMDSPSRLAVYRIQIISANRRAPDGVNRSAWSDVLNAVQIYFGGLAVPGMAESRKLTLDVMRDYYA